MVYKICSFSGGGIRGMIPATIIHEMLMASKKHGGTGYITDFCDHVVGTSAGGIMAAGLVVSEDGINPKYNPEIVSKILRDNAQRIFPNDSNTMQHKNIAMTAGIAATSFTTYIASKLVATPIITIPAVYTPYAIPLTLSLTNPFFIGGIIGIIVGAYAYKHSHYTDGWFAPKYSRDGIDATLNEYFGNLTLKDTIIPFTTFSFSLSDGTIKSFSTIKAQKISVDNFFLRDAVAATSAAPTFFAHKVIITEQDGEKKEHHEVDSGLYNNSPISLVLAMLKKHAPDEILEKIETEGISFLSIGTGLHMHKNIHQSMNGEGILGWAPLATRTAMEGIEYASIIEGKYMHNSSRIDVEMLDDIPMDSSDVNTINMLQRIASDRALELDVMDYVKCVIKSEQEFCKIQGNLPFENEFFKDLI